MSKKITISIHQPNYLPWLGFFKKISASDIFVFLNDVQYEKNGWHNRNKIRNSDGWMWLTVPTNAKLGMKLNEVKIDYSSNWQKKHLKSIEINYSKSTNFKKFWHEIEMIYNKKHELLMDLNLELIKFIMKNLNIKTQTIFSSKLKIRETSSERILSICKKLDAKIYLSGALGKEYLNLDDFQKNGIEVIFQNFKHPFYDQNYKPFISNMAAIDLLFNRGDESPNILNDSSNF